MTAAPASLDVVWRSPDGSSVSIDPAGLAIAVAAGVRIDVAIQPRGAARLAVALRLAGPGRPEQTATAGRFVVIPLGDASFLVAVAEPADDPVILIPVPSSPAWVLAGAAMPSHDGWLTARRPEGAGIEFKIVPAPAEMSVCALQVSAVPPSGARFKNTREPAAKGAVRFSVPKMSPQLLALECEWEFHAEGRTPPNWP